MNHIEQAREVLMLAASAGALLFFLGRILAGVIVSHLEQAREILMMAVGCLLFILIIGRMLAAAISKIFRG